MNNSIKKKFLLPGIFFAAMLVAFALLTVIFCYTTEPEIAEGDFPFSITYEYKGEVGVLSGVYHCKFSSSSTYGGFHERWWDGGATYDQTPKYDYAYIIDRTEDYSLSMHEHMIPGYFMGDPLHQDYYDEYYDGVIAPYIEYYDYKNGITLDDSNREAVLEAIDFKIIDYTYPEPIENSFHRSGLCFEADNLPMFVLATLVFLLLCIIFVRKEKDYTYNAMDKISIVLNFLVGLVAMPFISIVCLFIDINGTAGDVTAFIAYTIPVIGYTCLALSIVFRRKGYSKTGIVIQFVGTAMFALLIASDIINGHWF